MRETVAAVVLAAGQSLRYGRAKLLDVVRGEPMLNHTLRCLLDGGVDRIVLVTGLDAAFAAVPLAHDSRVTVVVNPDPGRGMFSSVQAGLAAADGDCVIVLPGDMPFVRSAT